MAKKKKITCITLLNGEHGKAHLKWAKNLSNQI